jgi:hypothetical protein
MSSHLGRARAGLVGALVVACGGPSASPGRPSSSPRETGYAGATTCGAPVPEVLVRGLPAGEPAAEPMFGRPEVTSPDSSAPAPEPDLALVVDRLQGHLHALTSCGRNFYARAPQEGALAIDTRFAIAADGQVTGVEVGSGAATLDRCLCERLYAIDYRGVGAAAIVRYPLRLSP